MRPGMFPSQQRAMRQAFKKADKFDHFRARTRRSLVLGGVASVAAAAAAFWVGTRTADAAVGREADSHPRPAQHEEWLRALAVGPISELRSRAMHLTAALESAEVDDGLWVGFHRLCSHSLTHADDTALRNRLLSFAPRSPVPHVAEALAALRAHR